MYKKILNTDTLYYYHNILQKFLLKPLSLLYGYNPFKCSDLIIILTENCNRNCLYCSVGSPSSKNNLRVMNYNLFKNILDNIKKDFNGDLPRLNLFGGEPLTHPDFKDIFLTAHQQGFPLRLYTNGDLLRENIHFISNLKDLNLEIMIGLHNNNFEALKKNINTLKKLTIPVDITCPTIFLSLNKLSFREIIKQFQNSELRTLIFGHSVTIQKNQEIFTSAFYEELVDINKYYQKNPKIKFFPQIENSNLLKFYKDPTYPAKPRCLNNFFCPIVQPNGEIFFCNRYPQAVGSLDKQTLQDIWNNSLYKKLREKTFHQDFHQECRNCCWGIYY